MARFKDKADREWVVELDAPTIRTIRSELSIDLVDEKGQGVAQVASDAVLLVDTLWLICREQALARDVDDLAFGKSLVGEAIEHAERALEEAIVNFTPPGRRKLMEAILRKLHRLDELGAREIDRLSDQDISDAIHNVFTTQLKSVTNSPDSSASPPED